MQFIGVGIDAITIAIGSTIGAIVNTHSLVAILVAAIVALVALRAAIVGVGLKIDTCVADFGIAWGTAACAIEAKTAIDIALRAAHPTIARIILEIRAGIAHAAWGQSRIATTLAARACPIRPVTPVATHAAVHRIRRHINAFSRAKNRPGCTRALPRLTNAARTTRRATLAAIVGIRRDINARTRAIHKARIALTNVRYARRSCRTHHATAITARTRCA